MLNYKFYVQLQQVQIEMHLQYSDEHYKHSLHFIHFNSNKLFSFQCISFDALNISASINYDMALT